MYIELLYNVCHVIKYFHSIYTLSAAFSNSIVFSAESIQPSIPDAEKPSPAA